MDFIKLHTMNKNCPYLKKYNIEYYFRILSGSYDNSIHIWNTKGQHKLAIPGHTSPVKAISWVSFNGNQAVFAR